MSINVLIVGANLNLGSHDSSEAPFLQIYNRCNVTKTSILQKKQCSAPGQLIDTVAYVRNNAEGQDPNPLIDVLDLCYHSGSDGSFHMGNGVLFFAPCRTGFDIAAALRPNLTTNARVRLLGCDTAADPDMGRALLTGLWEAFGKSVVVYGTVSGVDSGRFNQDAPGFDQAQDGILVSSTDARDPVSWSRAIDVATYCAKSLAANRS